MDHDDGRLLKTTARASSMPIFDVAGTSSPLADFFDEQANRKRSKATKSQPRKDGKLAAKEQVVQQNVVAPVNHRKGQQAKAAASKTNPGAVARGDKLAKGGQPHQKKPTGSKSEPVEKTLSERRLGELLKEQPKAKGGAEKGVGRRGKQCGSVSEPHSTTPTLADQGIDKKLSSRFGRMRDAPPHAKSICLL